MILFINACVREESRTKLLADCVLSRIAATTNDEITEVRLDEIDFGPTDREYLELRDELIAEGDYEAPEFELANQFSCADRIVIAAPYWDLSFPASLKQYFEKINVPGITFSYLPDGTPKSLCCAKELIYVMTAGGNYVPDEYGFGYVKALAQGYYGIRNVRLIQATGLDIYGADVEQIMRDAMGRIPQVLS